MRYLVGIGNYSMGDDSIGPRLIESIDQNNLAQGFIALDLSSNYLNLFSYFNPATEKILIIDSALMGINPGDFLFFTPNQVDSTKKLSSVTTHQGDLLKVLYLAKEMNETLPAITIMGIEPQDLKESWELSPILQNKFHSYIESAIKELMAD